MPAKRKIQKEDILKASISIISHEGLNALNARKIAKKLGCSTQPLFYIYENMDVLKKDVIDEIVKSLNWNLCLTWLLEKYIDENGHLPNIPSSQEIEEEGLSLGEMQQKQMEKIEELTLYIIQQNKEIEEINEKYDELEERIEDMEALLNK